jgi:YidC/Oxa1 family membrane protein insertase
LLQLIRWSSGCCPFGGIGVLDGLIGGIAKIMVWGINGIAYFVENKGVAIIILTFLVWLLTFPIYRYSQVAMLRMQDLAPEVARLKEQCKDDPKKLQLEQMKLYRERGANPIMSCVPMLLQMPIWIALYTGLGVAITLRQAPFVWWIKDLAMPDAALGPFHPVNVSVLSYIGSWAGWQVNVLPVLVVVAMFMQMRLQPQPTSTPEMEKQQKLMKYMMPLMMFFFFYIAPSGLNLYILTNSTLGYFGQKYIRRRHELDKLKPKSSKPPKPKSRIMSFIEDKMEAAQKFQQTAGENKWEKKKPKK